MTTQNGTILIIDDEAKIVQSLADLLVVQGYKVDTATSGFESLGLLEKKGYDLVITDIRMPNDVSGLNVLSSVKTHSPETSVMMYTGYAEFELAVASLRLNADDYVLKNSPYPVLLERVEQAVRNAQHRRHKLQVNSNLSASASVEGRILQLSPTTRLDTANNQVMINGQSIRLTRTEFHMLFYLGINVSRVVSCRELVREIRGYEVTEAKGREIVRPHVANLHKRINTVIPDLKLIENHRGFGYRLAVLEH